MDEVTQVDKDIIKKQDNITLADWWCALNSWEWPIELPDEDCHSYKKNSRRGQLMNYIQEITGSKLTSRRWNKDEMNDEEFECWWVEGHDVYWEKYGEEKAKHEFDNQKD